MAWAATGGERKLDREVTKTRSQLRMPPDGAWGGTRAQRGWPQSCSRDGATKERNAQGRRGGQRRVNGHRKSMASFGRQGTFSIMARGDSRKRPSAGRCRPRGARYPSSGLHGPHNPGARCHLPPWISPDSSPSTGRQPSWWATTARTAPSCHGGCELCARSSAAQLPKMRNMQQRRPSLLRMWERT